MELPPSLEPTDTGGGTLAVHSVSTWSAGEIAPRAEAGLNGEGRGDCAILVWPQNSENLARVKATGHGGINRLHRKENGKGVSDRT